MGSPPGAELPDPFRFDDGGRVVTPADWKRRRTELLATIVDLEYGGLPPAPDGTEIEILHTAALRHTEGVRYRQLRVRPRTPAPFWFRLDIHLPPGDGPFPAVLTGDGCWRYANDAIAETLTGRGIALAVFSRTEFAPDTGSTARDTGLYTVYPKATFGALAAWAWGVHRAVDALLATEEIDAGRIGIVGHSRGGKTALLAGATDRRIALTGVNGSGCGGGGCFRWQAEGSETLADILRVFPYWFGPKLHDYIGRESDLPFDQHGLAACVAPRGLIFTNGLDDLWANPAGAQQTWRATREVYRFLGAEDAIGAWVRPGGHDHGAADWGAFLAFFDRQLLGKAGDRTFDDLPYPDLPRPYGWTAPLTEL